MMLGIGFHGLLCALLLQHKASASSNDARSARGDVMRREEVESFPTKKKDEDRDPLSQASLQKLQSMVQKLATVDAEDANGGRTLADDDFVEPAAKPTDGPPTDQTDELEELTAEPRGPSGEDQGLPSVDPFKGERQAELDEDKSDREEEQREGESLVQQFQIQKQNASSSPRNSVDALENDVQQISAAELEQSRRSRPVGAGAALNEISDEGANFDVDHSDNLVKSVVQSYLDQHKDQFQQLLQAQTEQLQTQTQQPQVESSPAPKRLASGSGVAEAGAAETAPSKINVMRLGTPEQRDRLNALLLKLKKNKALLQAAENMQDQALDTQDTKFKKTEGARVAVDTTEDSFLQLKAQMLQEVRTQLKQKEERLIDGYNKKKKELEDMQVEVKQAEAKGQKHLQKEARRLHVMKRRLARKVNHVIQNILNHWMSGAESEASFLGDSDAAGLEDADDELD